MIRNAAGEENPLTSNALAAFPRVNLISILAGTLALISAFLPWWGLNGSAFGFTASEDWSLWGQPYLGDTSSSPTLAQTAHTMAILNLVVLAIVFITAGFVFLGSFDEAKWGLAIAFTTSISSLFVYAGAVSSTLTNSCQGASSCPSGPVGSTVAGGTVINWGFQTGFYLMLVAGILTLVALVFHQIFLQPKESLVRGVGSPSGKFCSNCAAPLTANAKFCSNCAHAVP